VRLSPFPIAEKLRIFEQGVTKVDKMVWVYLGEDLDSISDADKEMLRNLKKSGKFSRLEITEFNKSLVAHQYEKAMLDHAVNLHKKDDSKSVKEWYTTLADKQASASHISFPF
jgi:hypothetical protein